jgi:hypothetical protein
VSYVIDTSVISMLHRNYYRKQFPTLWKLFDAMVDDGKVTSCREALRELEEFGGSAYNWAKEHPELFSVPSAKDGAMVAKIYAVKNFQANIEKQKIYKGGLCADPFLIARAHSIEGTVLTMEQFKQNAAKIPNICKHFNVPCVDLEEFMEKEKWTF